MYSRQKIILEFISRISPIREKKLQLLLFLFASGQQNPSYDFIPGKQGPHSFTLQADIKSLIESGWLICNNSQLYLARENEISGKLKPSEKLHIDQINNNFGNLDDDGLSEQIFKDYPLYSLKNHAISPVPAKDDSGIKAINDVVLFTLGYEGLSLEAYLLRLLKNRINALIDVRCNPFSHKFGFSKNQLKSFCAETGINYFHFPETGIPSSQRKGLSESKEYQQLFSRYQNEILPQNMHTIETIFNLLELHHRIALTCFEASCDECHRKPLSEAISQLQGFLYEIRHI